MLPGFCHPRLNAAGVKPSQTLSYWGFTIPELCTTEAVPSQIVCLDDIFVIQYPELSCFCTDVLDDSLQSSTMFSWEIKRVPIRIIGAIERVPMRIIGTIQCYCTIYLPISISTGPSTSTILGKIVGTFSYVFFQSS